MVVCSICYYYDIITFSPVTKIVENSFILVFFSIAELLSRQDITDGRGFLLAQVLVATGIPNSKDTACCPSLTLQKSLIYK